MKKYVDIYGRITYIIYVVNLRRLEYEQDIRYLKDFINKYKALRRANGFKELSMEERDLVINLYNEYKEMGKYEGN